MPTIKVIPPLIDPKTISEGFTQSELETLDVCPYKWWLKYDQLLGGPHCDWNLLIGSGWHTFQEQFHGRQKIQPFTLQVCKENLPLSADDEAYKEQIERTFQVYQDCYQELFQDEVEGGGWQIESVEEVADLTISFEGVQIRLKGKLDLLGSILARRSIVDHKTLTAWDSTERGWDTRFQFMFYFWLQRSLQPDQPARQLIVNAMRKPSIRQKKDESFVGYLNRLRGEILRDQDNYFREVPLVLTQGKLEAFETNVLAPKFRKLKYICDPSSPRELVETLALERRTKNCIDPITGKECEFLGICEKGYTPNNYAKREHKHQELNPE